MRTNKNTYKIILAVIVAFLATMISYSAFSNMQGELTEQKKIIEFMQKNKPNADDTFAYAVATSNLKAGEIVSEQDVDFQNFNIDHKDAFEIRSDVVNKVLLKDIASGDIFTSAHIAKISEDDMSLKEGYRALTLPADSFQGKANTMVSGSYVDIYSATGEASWVLENVRIMSLESSQKPSSSSKTAGGSTSATAASTPAPVSISDATAITFEVPAARISDVIFNVSKSKLVLVTRGANDRKVSSNKPKVAHQYPSSFSSSYSSRSMGVLPKIPASPPISDFSGLPQPIQPLAPQNSVEVIEANVKSKVTFD